MNANPAVDTKLMKALAHPLRQRILLGLNKRVASPSELADEMGEPLGNVSYHVRMLVDLDAIELVGTTPRRGALEHHYKAKVRPFFDEETYASFPVATRRAIVGDVLKEIWQSVGDAADAGSFDEKETHVTRDHLVLDEQGRTDLNALLTEMFDRAQDITAESVERLAADGDAAERLDTWFVTMHYKAAEPPVDAKMPKARKGKGAKTTKRRKPAAKR